MIDIAMLPDYLKKLVKDTFTEEEIKSLELFVEEDGSIAGIGFKRDGYMCKFAEPDKFAVIAKLEDYVRESYVNYMIKREIFGALYGMDTGSGDHTVFSRWRV